ncbi:BTB And C-terminal Kelch [Sparganum proliferum]
MSITQAHSFEDEFPLIRSCPALDEIRLAGEIKDLKIEVKNGEVLHAHRIILAARIPSLRATLSGPLGEANSILRWPTVPLSLATALISYVYTGKMEMTQANVMGIVAFAKMLKIPAVEIWGSNLIADSVALENLANTWDFAKSLKIGLLMDACINLMQEQFIRFVPGDLFVRLPGDTVLSLVRSEDLLVDSEEQVFEAISRWVCPGGVVDVERLNTYAPKMLKEVQWHQTTDQFREHLLDNHPIYQTNVECLRLMAAVEQWIGAAATPKRMCPFNQHSRNGRRPQMIFVFGRDKDADRWSVLRFDSELQNEERIADMQLRRYATYSVVGERIFVVGGQTMQQSYSTSVDEFLMRERHWRKRASLAVGRQVHAASVVKVGAAGMGCEENALIGVFGGYYAVGGTVTRLSSCEVYDVSQDRWYKLPDLREKRSGPAAVCLPRDNRVFVFGGRGDSAWTASVEFCQLRADWQGKATSSSTAEFWLPAAPMRTARAVLSATPFRGRIIAAGGFDGKKNVNAVEIFSPPDTRCPLGQWTDLAAMKQPRSFFTLVTTCDAVFALGGEWRSENTVEALTAPEGSDSFSNDLISWTWSTKSPLETLAEICGAVCVRI